MSDLQEMMGSVIRRERRERGLTLKDLSAQAGVSMVYLGEIERGKKYPSAGVLEQIALALRIALPELLELLANALRGDQSVETRAIGFTLPGTPRAAVRRIVDLLDPNEAATMADLGAFFLARRTGESTPARDNGRTDHT